MQSPCLEVIYSRVRLDGRPGHGVHGHRFFLVKLGCPGRLGGCRAALLAGLVANGDESG